MMNSLQALGAAATPQEYARAVSGIDPFLTEADWAALPLAPANLDAALRYFLWYRPAGGFDLAPLHDLRHRLADLAGRVPAAPVAPALALHDQLLQAFTRLPGRSLDHTEWELRQRYQHVFDFLENHDPPDAQTGRPFRQSPAYAALLAAHEAADALVNWFMMGSHPHLLGPVVAQVAARFPAEFQQRLLALTPSEQLELLGFLDFSRQPALLRELAEAPQARVRQRAVRLLQKWGKHL